jgi:uncharacterized protein with HEPN domain
MATKARPLGDVIDYIDAAIDKFGAYTAQPPLPEVFRFDDMRMDALKQVLLGITEATTRIPDTEKAKAPDIPWREIVDMGNRLRHDYDDFNIEYIEALQRNGDLERLRKALSNMDPNVPQVRRYQRRTPRA